MSEFTPQDRERAQKTLTALEGLVKVTDERHEDMQKQHQEFKDKFEKYEKRLEKCEGFRNRIYGYVIAVGAGAVATAEGIKTLFFGNGS